MFRGLSFPRLAKALIVLSTAAGEIYAQPTLDDLQSIKLTKPDFRKVRVVGNLIDPQAPWSYVPDAGELPKKAPKTELSIALPHFTRSLAFSARTADLVVALDVLAATEITGESTIQRESWSLHPFRMSTGELLQPITLATRTTEVPGRNDQRGNASPTRPDQPQGSRKAGGEELILRNGCLLSVGRDGDLAVLRTNSAGRLDIWSLTEGKHLVAWIPYQDESRASRTVLWAAGLPDRGVLTLNRAGRLIRWKLPECRAVYERNVGPMQTEQDRSNLMVDLHPGLSPNHRHLAVWSGNSLLLLDIESGECLAVLAGQNAPGQMQPTFHPDGSQLAVTQAEQGTESLLIFDLKKGRELSRILLPSDTWPRAPNSEFRCGGFTWANKRCGVVGGRVVVDLAKQRTAWRFDAAELNTVLDPLPVSFPGPGFCYYDNTQRKSLNVVRLPDEVPVGSDRPAFVIMPGAMIEVVNKVDAPENAARDLEKSLARSLAELGFKTDQQQPIKLLIESELRATTREVTLRYFPSAKGEPGKDRQVAVQELVLKASFVVGDKTVWTRSLPYLPQSIETMPSNPAQGPGQQLLELQWRRTVSYAPNSLFAKIPRYVPDPDYELPQRPYPTPQPNR